MVIETMSPPLSAKGPQPGMCLVEIERATPSFINPISPCIRKALSSGYRSTNSGYLDRMGASCTLLTPTTPGNSTWTASITSVRTTDGWGFLTYPLQHALLKKITKLINISVRYKRNSQVGRHISSSATP
jgi:hypothetical protein